MTNPNDLSSAPPSSATTWWTAELDEACVRFQFDLSCLVDQELEQVAAIRAIAHLEDCPVCRSFFEDVRQQVRAHRDLVENPEGLAERYATLLGPSFDGEIETIELIERLSSIFYQLGKAYVLTAIDPEYWNREVFEHAVTVESERARGRGFVDGVLESGRGDAGGIDWLQARGMLNGRLETILEPLEKGKRLLAEALAVDPTHEEARFYVAYVHANEGKRVRAAKEFKQLFDSAVNEVNRGLAATSLARIYALEEEYRKAIACCRWVTMAGLADSDEKDRFYYVRFNIGMYYAHLGDRERSLRAFRELLDRHPGRVGDVVKMFLNAPRLRAVIDHQSGFSEALLGTCPELFVGAGPDPTGGSEE